MENFVAYNPTRLHFGRGVVGQLGENARRLGKKALLVYGGGSVKQNGSYRDTREQLGKHGVAITEFGGIKPNPRVEDVRKAAEIGREEQVELVVAVGGGSVIDSAKIIALSLVDNADAWEIMTGRHKPSSALPLIAVLTLAATGTEMNAVAVLQNPETMEKIGFRHELIYPVHSFLDPSYTLSVPAHYTAYGIVDLVAHCLEAWFGDGDAHLSDRLVTAIIQEAMEAGPRLMNDLQNYELRARIMWAATNALNNLTIYGRGSGDWGVHALGHTLSFLYDTPHGATLSIMYPAWMEVMKERAGHRIRKLGRMLFQTESPGRTIGGMRSFFESLDSPVSCRDAGIGESKLKEILGLMNRNSAGGIRYPLNEEEREEILSRAM